MSFIEIKDLHKKYKDNVVLNGINLSIEKGNVIGIIGPSGTGKSTILRCINQLEIPEKGSIVINGKEIDLSNKKNKKDILELKRRFKKESCTFTRLCGCYVDADRNKITTFGETFLNLEDEEFYKYLEIAKKVMSGVIGNNLLELEFPTAEEAPGGRQQFLMGLRESALKSDELMDAFYDLVIESYSYVGNYLILVFHDAYDVMTKTSDNNKLDESEEVYEYLLCAICPVTLTKPGLGYRENENRIGPRIRDWVVGVPDTGFVFPALPTEAATSTP